MTTNGNSQAFASLAFSNDGTEVGCPGLTKREYFAAMAMQGIVTLTCDRFATGSDEERARARQVFAKEAVRFADALIAALNDGSGE